MATIDGKKWLMCEWDGDSTIDAMVQDDASFDSLIETRSYVYAELVRFYDEIGQDLVPLGQYVNGPITSNAPNIIYDLPTEADAPDRVVLSKSTNGDLKFGLVAWRNGCNPDFAD